jgi:hypothetical protein
MPHYGPLWLQANSYAASVDRRLPGALWPNGGVSGCAVSPSSGMIVNVAAGSIAVPTQNNTGSTLCVTDATETVTLAAAPGSGSNRYDLVICQPRGNDLDGGANNDFIFTNVTGTAAATPTVPAVPAGALALAQVYVPGGSASVTAGNITDVRPGQLLVPIADNAWTTVTAFTNGWVSAFGNPTSFKKIGTQVYLHGAVKSGTAGTAAFTLPVGYRPQATWIVGALGNSAGTLSTVQLNIAATGVVQPAQSPATWVSLDGICFDTTA